MYDDFVKLDSAPFYKNESGTDKKCHLLWGDGVFYQDSSVVNNRRKVKAPGYFSPGWVEVNALGGQSLLEFYFIDVGQGDGVLIKTPGFRHVMIDGGYPRSQQDTGKNAADFVDWKFFKDYGMDTIELEALIASHCDADHYGGLWDLLDVSQNHELDASDVRVENAYHAGLSWWKSASGSKTLGTSIESGGEDFWTRFISDRASVSDATSGIGAQLHGWWGSFFKAVLLAKTRSGGATPIKRLSQVDNYLPEFGPKNLGEPVIRVLGPLEFDINSAPALRKYTGGTSINTNGVSLLMRVDYGGCRVLLTGDLNKASQTKLLDDYAGTPLEFACDVAKACHHGSDDISYRFLQAMSPAVTVISSGDNEGHDHPRPNVIAASATTGYMHIENDELVSPLIFSTELARSLDLGRPDKFEEKDTSGATTNTISGRALNRSRLHITSPDKARKMEKTLVVGDLIYGLVNVRTDGSKILCATRDENSKRWRINVINSRFSSP